MSESTSGSGWIYAAEFHEAPGVSDWRVTGTGPQSVFTATSLSQAADLIAPVVAAAEQGDSPTTLGNSRTVRVD